MNTEPKITIQVIDNKWIVTRGKYRFLGELIKEETKIFTIYRQLEDYLKENLTH